MNKIVAESVMQLVNAMREELDSIEEQTKLDDPYMTGWLTIAGACKAVEMIAGCLESRAQSNMILFIKQSSAECR